MHATLITTQAHNTRCKDAVATKFILQLSAPSHKSSAQGTAILDERMRWRLTFIPVLLHSSNYIPIHTRHHRTHKIATCCTCTSQQYLARRRWSSVIFATKHGSHNFELLIDSNIQYIHTEESDVELQPTGFKCIINLLHSGNRSRCSKCTVEETGPELLLRLCWQNDRNSIVLWHFVLTQAALLFALLRCILSMCHSHVVILIRD